ncbi:hypothetical protein FRC05_000343, partial [Tulasnella sp. 425]
MSKDWPYGKPRRHKARLTRDISFQNLIALANDKENYEVNKIRRKGKELVWRDPGEPPVLLESYQDCLEHAYNGGLRAGFLGFSARSGVNLFILFFNLTKTSKYAFLVAMRMRASLVLRAIFNFDSLRFGAMLGAFVTIYKFILNALPILFRRSELRKQFQDTQDRSMGIDPSAPAEPTAEAGSRHDSSYPSSDVEQGLSVESLKRQKSALKQPSPTPASSSMESSRASSPSRIEKSEDGAKRARFAEGDDLIRTAPTPPPHDVDSTQSYTAHLSKSVGEAFRVMAENGYVYKRWHATVAGAVAGAIAILFERKSRRLSISQQMFVRGLQGSFNFWSKQFGIRVPFGSVWVFAFCCGQIMYGFLLRPDTIPKSYETWIQKASVVPDAAIQINRQLVHDGTLNISLQKKLAHGFTKPWSGDRSIVTEENKMDMLQQAAKAIAGEALPPMASCAAIHPHRNHCIPTGLWRVYESGKKRLMKDPFKTLVKALWGTVRSSAFLGVYVAIYQSYICFLHFLHRLPLDPSIAPAFRRFILSKPLWWLGGILSGMSLFIEDARRRPELAMYVLPKGLESGWKLVRGEVLGIPTQRKNRGWKSDVALSAAGMAMVMSTYQ